MNLEPGHQTDRLIVVGRGIRKVNRRDQNCVIFHHDDYKDGENFVELYAVERWVKVCIAGLAEKVFDGVQQEEAKEEEEAEMAEAVPEEAH